MGLDSKLRYFTAPFGYKIKDRIWFLTSLGSFSFGKTNIVIGKYGGGGGGSDSLKVSLPVRIEKCFLKFKTICAFSIFVGVRRKPDETEIQKRQT